MSVGMNLHVHNTVVLSISVGMNFLGFCGKKTLFQEYIKLWSIFLSIPRILDIELQRTFNFVDQLN